MPASRGALAARAPQRRAPAGARPDDGRARSSGTVGVLAGLVASCSARPRRSVPADAGLIHPCCWSPTRDLRRPASWPGPDAISAETSGQWYVGGRALPFRLALPGGEVMLTAPPSRHAQAVVAACLPSKRRQPVALPIAIAAAYYLVPKLTGHTINNYPTRRTAFWTLLLLRGVTGGWAPHRRPGARVDSHARIRVLLVAVPFPGRRPQLREGLTGGLRSNVWVQTLSLLAYLRGDSADRLLLPRFARVSVHLFPGRAAQALLGAFFRCRSSAPSTIWCAHHGRGVASAAIIRLHFSSPVLGCLHRHWPGGAGWAQGRRPPTIRRCRRAIAGGHPALVCMPAAAGRGLLLLGSLVLGFSLCPQQAAAFGFCPATSARFRRLLSCKNSPLFLGLRALSAVMGPAWRWAPRAARGPDALLRQRGKIGPVPRT